MRQWRGSLPVLWSVALAALLLGPALGPGYVLSYDMVWVPDLALRPDFLGVASGLPRAVPSDAVVAVLDLVLPGMLLQKLVLVGCLVGGGLGAARLAPAGSVLGRLVAVSVYQWNPFVVERLLIGHWPVLVGYAVLPWVLLAARRWREQGRVPPLLLFLVPLGSLSASAGLATAVVLLAFAAGRAGPVGARRTRLGAVALVLAANAPWVVSGLLHVATATTDAAGARAFALAGEGLLPGPLAALGLGGIWNGEVVPPSRTGILAVLALLLLLALAVLGARPWWVRHRPADRWAYAGCWLVGYGLAVLTWLAPGAVAWLAGHVPGGGLVRDGARALALCAPLVAALAAQGAVELQRRLASRAAVVPVARWSLGVVLILLPVTLLPDAALGLGGRLRPADYPAAYAQARDAVADRVADGARSDVLLLPLTSYRQPAWNHDHKVLDPLGRYLTPDYVASDQLVVSGETVEGEDPRVAQAAQALAAPTPQDRSAALARLGVGFVAVERDAPGTSPTVTGEVLLDTADLAVTVLPGVSEATGERGWYAAMALAWLLFLGPVAVGLARGLRRVTAVTVSLLQFRRT